MYLSALLQLCLPFFLLYLPAQTNCVKRSVPGQYRLRLLCLIREHCGDSATGLLCSLFSAFLLPLAKAGQKVSAKQGTTLHCV